MNLAIDVGNSQVKFGLFQKNELREMFIEKEAIDGILSENKITHAIISKSGEDDEIESKLKEKKIHTVVLSHELKLPIEILYKTPETLGADRIAGSVGANFKFPDKHVLKIDFGTCITYDIVNNKNQYVGGSISPGMMMRFKAMHNYTAKLPLIDPMQFTTFELTGTDTNTAIVSGVMNGIKEEVRGIIKEYEKRFGSLKVVATGGDSGIFVTLVNCEIFARPYLVLEGMNRILNYNLK
jgi:type III pantothenate kinase